MEDGQVLPIASPGDPASTHNSRYTSSTTLTMFFSSVAVVCAFSLLSSARAAALDNRQSDCGFVCPPVDTNGSGPSVLTEIDDASFSCTFAGAFGNPCTYDSVGCDLFLRLRLPDCPLPNCPLQSSGALVGVNSSGSCPKQATSQCPTRRRRDYDDWKPTPTWSPGPYPSWSPDSYPSWSPDPYPSWSKPPTPTMWSKPTPSWSKPGPSPSPWKPQPPKKEPCKYTCPQKNLAGGALTDEAIRGQDLFCRYPSNSCEQCGFCKYSTVSPHLGYAATAMF